jgi:hypothetical protein
MTDMMTQEYREYFLTRVHEPGRTIVAKLLRNLEFYNKNKLNQYLMLLSNVKGTKFTTMYKDDLTNPSFVEKLRADLYDFEDEPDNYFFGILDGLSEISPTLGGGGKRRRGKRSTKRNRTKSRKSRKSRNRH